MFLFDNSSSNDWFDYLESLKRGEMVVEIDAPICLHNVCIYVAIMLVTEIYRLTLSRLGKTSCISVDEKIGLGYFVVV